MSTTASTRKSTTPGSAAGRGGEAPRRQAPAPATPAMVRHARAGTLALRGPRSGRIYLFSDREASAVLAEDLEILLRTGVLERLTSR